MLCQLIPLIGFEIIKSHYSVLVRSMPDDYMNTVSQLERYLTGDHIGSILECSDVFTANQRILDCLLDRIDTKEGLLDFFDQLNSIRNAPALTAAIESVKKGIEYIRMYIWYLFTENFNCNIKFKPHVYLFLEISFVCHVFVCLCVHP